MGCTVNGLKGRERISNNDGRDWWSEHLSCYIRIVGLLLFYLQFIPSSTVSVMHDGAVIFYDREVKNYSNMTIWILTDCDRKVKGNRLLGY